MESKIERTLNPKENRLLEIVLESEEPEKAIITAIQICEYFIEEKPDLKETTAEQELKRFYKWLQEKITD